jgi:ABC-2 type transport system ATP-binding protein
MIEISGIYKRYGKLIAVNNLNLQINKGEIFAFLGPNGAGKTTTIRMLTTLTRVTSGTIKIGGFDINKQPDQVKKLFGIVQQHSSLDHDLSVRDNLILHAKIRHFSVEQARNAITKALAFSEMTDRADVLIDALSGGLKRRVQIARALMHEPQLIFLDEPTIGLDAQTRRSLWDMIRKLKSKGITVFLTTHYIEEAEALCDRVGIIHKGQLIALGTPLKLRNNLGLYTVEITRDGQDTEYSFFVDSDSARCYSQNAPQEARSVIVRESNLEDVFVEITGQKTALSNNN